MSKETVAKKLQTVAENQQKVYDTGYNGGYNRGYNEGKQAEYDAFWGVYQQNRQRTDYNQSFGFGWDDTIFKPKYDIRPVSALQMFSYFQREFQKPPIFLSWGSRCRVFR